MKQPEKYLDCSIADFTEQLASKSSVPGGGGASALVGAIGVALGDMVGQFTVGKKKYAAVEGEIQVLMAKAQDLRVKLLSCVEKDAAAFEPLSRAYGIPKEDPTRDTVMETCLRDAAAVPMELLDLCGAAIALLEAFAEKGSAIVLSDAATGIMFCQSAMYGAAVNVYVNTRLMKDRDVAEQYNQHVKTQLETYAPVAERVYGEITGRLT